MVVTQQLIEEIDGFVRDKTLVLRCDKAMPRLLLESSQNIIILCIQFYFVLVKVVEQIIRAKDLGDLDKLIRVAVAVEEGLFPEDHGRKHGAETPHIEAVVVFLEIHQQLRALEVTRCDTHVVFGSRMVKFSQTPVNETKLPAHVSIRIQPNFSEMATLGGCFFTFLFS